MLYKKKLGKFGEELATKYLKSKDYSILEKNYRCKLGEIDIIAKKDNIFVFLEIKTRSGLTYGEPIESIDGLKIEKIKKVANFYLAKNNIEEPEIRFDIITLQKNYKKFLISHIINAF